VSAECWDRPVRYFAAICQPKTRPPNAHVFLFVAAAGSLVAVILVFTTSPGPGIGHFWIGLLLLLAIAVIVYRVLSFGTVAIKSIYGVLSAYLMLGLMFAAFYAPPRSWPQAHSSPPGRQTLGRSSTSASRH
jgi:hypothetical protein